MLSIKKLKADFKKRPIFTVFRLIIIVSILKIIWTIAWFQLNPKDPANPFFNSKYFRFSNYESDPLRMEEVARIVFPKGMNEEDVDEILLTDLFAAKSNRSPVKGHIFYIYNSAPWRLTRGVHSVVYDEKHKLVDVYPYNGRGIYSGIQLDDLVSKAQMEQMENRK